MTDQELLAAVRKEVREALSEQREILNAQEAADFLGYSRAMVDTLSGPNSYGPDALPVHRLTPGGDKRFLRRELLEHLAKR